MAASRSGPATTRKRGFKQSTYAGVGCFTAKTLIEYVREGKRAGTKSAERYNVYAEAKTVEQSISLGSRVADLLNDFEKGILLPVGGLVRREEVSADQFAAMSKLDRLLYNFARKARGEGRMSLKTLAREKCKAKAKRVDGERQSERPARAQRRALYGLEGKMPQLLSGETIEIQHGRLMAEKTAARILARANADGENITDDDLLSVFRQWAFKRNDVRVNVIPEGQRWVFSDTLGLLRDRCGKYLLAAPSRYQEVCRVLNRWMKDNASCTFCCTSISLNKAYAARLHRDSNNCGPSICRAIGHFTGGRLGYFADDDSAIELEALQSRYAQQAVYLDVKADFQVFNGNCAHYVEPFEGERLSFVFFCVSNYWRAAPSVLAQLRERGFALPTDEWMSHAESLLPQPRGYGARRLPRMASLADMFGQPPPRKVVKRRPSEIMPKQKQPSVIALLAKSQRPAHRAFRRRIKGPARETGTRDFRRDVQ